MSSHDPRIDAYIARSADFARPILEHLRAVVHASCKDVEETIKWGSPHFLYAGAMLCHMAAFKQHVAFGFWKSALIDGITEEQRSQSGMGQFGRIETLADLPAKRELAGLIRQAMKLNEQGIRRAAPKRNPRGRAVSMPAELAMALAANKKSREQFENFPPGQQREYMEWIAEAKQAATRNRRCAQAIEWMSEGKPRNWKYMSKR
ncbi:MAG TPA: YdeI/OmpD-associated family protein [Dokdonella sp.]|uniref:YdeI/OmpD-associated family protein n=1 Tax=Dokdonella sp. TaxID=2291710 RepID=UPI002D7E69D2|nr:YdeI/OmpD-associated family protein [Dokdonella sp.]HET9031420.1 YdeI/OmpD-associated family protein [Dokdonella sp.]